MKNVNDRNVINIQNNANSDKTKGDNDPKTAKEKNIKFLYTNADTLTNKISELEAIVGNENYDIIAVTEIFPKNIDDKKTCSFFIQGYSCIVQEFGRGICLYVKNDYEVNRLDTLESIGKDISAGTSSKCTQLSLINRSIHSANVSTVSERKGHVSHS